MKNTIKNINWLRTLTQLKEEILYNSDGQGDSFSTPYKLNIIDRINKSSIHTFRDSCLGFFKIIEDYYDFGAKFSVYYYLPVSGDSRTLTYGCKISFIYDFKTGSIRNIEKSGIFESMKPSDLLTFYKTNFQVSRLIQKSSDYIRKRNFVENPYSSKKKEA